jgi:molybdate transport system regulatory protein
MGVPDMSRPKDKLRETQVHPELRSKIHVRNDMIGSGKIELLRLLDETGSITAAANHMGIGYRRAWFLLDSLQACFAEPLFTTTRGGRGQGGSCLTETGRDLILRFTRFQTELALAADPFLSWLNEHQASAKTS